MNNIRDEKILRRIGENLKRLRQEKKLSQQDLANMADIELSQVYRIEKAKINPTATTLAALAEALEIHPGVFFD